MGDVVRPGARIACSVALALWVAPRSAAAFKERWHKAISWSALHFFKNEYLREIIAVQDEMDRVANLCLAGIDKWHFNDCDFEGASRNLAKVYEEILAALEKHDKPEAARLFGRALHAAQDFYAHSNWVELQGGKRAAEMPLVDESDGNWPTLSPWKPLANTGIIPVSETQPRPATVELPSPAAPDRSTLTVKLEGRDHPALISGEATLRLDCPEQVEIGHWDDRPGQSGGLAKDYPCRPGFHAACTLALRQTYQEWCRLLGMARAAATREPHALGALLEMVEESSAAMAAGICDRKLFRKPGFAGECK